MKTLWLFIALGLASVGANAELNRWIDENGVVHYSDTRPIGVDTDSVRNFSGKETVAAPAQAAPGNYVEREVELKKSLQEKQAASDKLAKEKALQDERQRNCTNAKESLRTLEAGGRIATYDASGEKVFLDDAALELRVQDARAAVQANCD